MNFLVSKWITETPVEVVRSRLSSFLSSGMASIANKLSNMSGSTDSFAHRCAEVWVFFFGRVLPLLQATFFVISQSEGT